MDRPKEYDNLIKAGAFAEITPEPAAVQARILRAKGYLEYAQYGADHAQFNLQRYMSLYDGFFELVQAVLEHYGVRQKDSGRKLAIQRVTVDLGLNPAIAIITKAHERRNGTSYESPFPPLSAAEVALMQDILRKALPAAAALTGMKL